MKAGKKLYRLKKINHASGVVFHHDDPKFIWTSIPRVASRCLLATFEEMGLKLEYLWGRWIKYNKDNKPWPKQVTSKTLEDYYVWSFVRNPYDRVVSAITYFYIAWPDFVAKNHQYFKEGHQAEPRMVGSHLIPSSFYTHIGGERFVDYIGKYENLNADWKLLLKKLGLSFCPLLENKEQWKSPHRPFDDYYGDDSDGRKNTVMDMYEDDFNLLGYDMRVAKP